MERKMDLDRAIRRLGISIGIFKFLNWLSSWYYLRTLTENDLCYSKEYKSVQIISEDEESKVLFRGGSRDRHPRKTIRHVYPWDFFKIVNKKYKL